MKAKPKFPDYLYGFCLLIGGTMGVISVYITVILLPSLPPAIASVAKLVLGGGYMDLGLLYIIAAISGAISGIVIGRIGYLIKPWKGVSIGGAILGGALVPILFFSMMNGEDLFGNVNETITANRLQRMYPEPKPIPTLQANFQELSSGEFFPNCAINSEGSRLVIGSGEHLTLWDLNEQKPVGEFPSDYVLPLALSPDGRILVLDDLSHNFVLRNLETGKQIAKVEDRTHFAISQNGQLFAAGYYRAGNFGIMLLDPSSGKEMGRIEVPDGFSTLALSPDGRLLAANAGNGQIILWDTATLKRVGKLKVADFYLNSLAFNQDGSRLAIGIPLHDIGPDASGIKLWDVESLLPLLSTRSPGSFNAAFSIDDQTLITTGDGHSSIYLWDANSLEPLGSVSGPNAEQSEVYVLPDGRVLACYWNGNSPDSIGIWTIESP